jgi:6-phosphogluconolactonase
MKTQIIHSHHFAADAAHVIEDFAHLALKERGIFRLGLCGGETPRPIHSELATIGSALPWNKIQITFGDERCVAPDDAQSNYRMARESLLDTVNIPPGNVFRIRGEIDPETAAIEYEHKLAQVAARFGEARYEHDLLLLGLGEDGHTASLFPGSPALDETVRNVIPATGPKPPPQRISMTFPLINAAKHVCFLVNSPGKAGIIEEIISGKSNYPAGRVAPETGGLTWLLGF